MKTISESQLSPYHDKAHRGLLYRLQAFIRQQRAAWPGLSAAHADLAGSLTRLVPLPDSEVVLQYNPGRTRSTTANVAADDVARRPCFLCAENLYPKQLGLPFADKWLILNNPFPIFTDHLVVSSTRHTAQLLAPALPVMLKFVEELEGSFSAFYNGARCGASAPDHLHFQACPAGLLPLEQQLMPLLDEPLCDTGRWQFFTRDNRGIGLCRAVSASGLHEHLNAMYARLNRAAASGDEADINVIVFGRPGNLAGACLPRRAHRPQCFFASGHERCVISPGAVDVAGLVILPRREDFDRMTPETMLQIYGEVCMDAGVMAACAP